MAAVSNFLYRIINIHHSFLPAFVGAAPYQRAAERGVTLIGATAHYVTTELDQGPIIEQDVIRVSHSHHAGELNELNGDIERTAPSSGTSKTTSSSTRTRRSHFPDTSLGWENGREPRRGERCARHRVGRRL